MEYRVCGPKLERGRDCWSVPPIPIPRAAGSAGEDNSLIIPPLVELVLRRRDESFLPVSYLLNTLCHEVCSDRACIEANSHLCLRYFDYATPSLISNHLMTPLLSPPIPLTRPGPLTILTRKSLLMIARTCIPYTYKLTNSSFHFTSSWRISNT
jgi:hypothetical protein